MEQHIDQQSEAAFLISYLHERDHPCPLCRYNLRNVTHNKCPECGLELRLTIERSYRREWIALPWLLGMALSISSAMILTIWAATIVYRINYGGPVAMWKTLAFTLNTLVLVMIIPLLCWQEQFMLADRKVQWRTIGWQYFVATLSLFIVVYNA